jgi:ABC-type uncharacterized transport system permease subunit
MSLAVAAAGAGAHRGDRRGAVRAAGQGPGRGLQVFFVEPVKSLYALSELSLKATPLILIALGLAVCFPLQRVEHRRRGQFVVGALAAGWVAMQAGPDTGLDGPRHRACRSCWPACWAAWWAAIVALLRDRFNANEILVSLMLVYVAEMLLSWLVYGPWKDPKGYNFPQTITFRRDQDAAPGARPARAHRRADRAGGGGRAVGVPVPHLPRLCSCRWAGWRRRRRAMPGFSSRSALWTALLLSGGMAGLAGGLEAPGRWAS